MLSIIVIVLGIRLAIIVLHMFSEMISNKFTPLKTQDYKLDLGDLTCLCLNMITETCFTVWLYNYNIIVLSTFFPLNVLCLLVCDDLLYAPYHHALHHKNVYHWIHFRHHKISHPSKSYIHASMEHPLEMMGALLMHAFLITILHPVLDKVSILVHISIKALGACLNHSGRDVQCTLYKTRCHHLHHMYGMCNFSQYVFIYDLLIGTYKTC